MHNSHISALLFSLVLLFVFSSGVSASTVTYAGPSFFPTILCHDLKGGCASTSVYTTFSATYTPSQTIPPNGSIRFGIGFMDGDAYMTDVFESWPAPQTSNAAGANYTTISTSAPFTKSIFLGDVSFLDIKFPSGLTAGTPVTVTYGDTSGGGKGFKVPVYESEAQIFVREDLTNSGTFSPSGAAYPNLWVTGTKADRVVTLVHSTADVGKNTSFLVKIMEGPDSYQQNSYIDGVFTGTVSFSSSDPSAVLPPAYTFTLADKGVKTFTAKFKTGGIQTITATISANSLSGQSNPIDVKALPRVAKIAPLAGGPVQKTMTTFFGSLHNHTAIGGHATQTTRFAYEYAKNNTLLDFVAVSEHCGTTDFHFDQVANMADEYYVPSRFVTFPAYEWTSYANGHRHVLFPTVANAFAYCDAPLSQASEKEQDSFSVSQFLSDVASKGGMAIIHHPAYMLTQTVNWGPTNSTTQRLVEMYSWHGRSEFWNNPLKIHNSNVFQFGKNSGNFVQDAIAAGYRLGFTADADNHFGMPASAVGKGWVGGFYSRMGVTGVLAESLNREKVWNALYERRTFGTTGARMLLSFKSDSHWMGEEFSSVKKPMLDMSVVGTAPLDYVKIFRNGKDEVFSWSGNGVQQAVDLSFTDINVVTGQTYSYYLRVHQTDDHYGWASPMWITYTGTGLAPAPSPISAYFDRVSSMNTEVVPWGITLAFVQLLSEWGGVLPTKTVPSDAPNPEGLMESNINFNGDTRVDNPYYDLYDLPGQPVQELMEGEITQEEFDDAVLHAQSSP